MGWHSCDEEDKGRRRGEREGGRERGRGIVLGTHLI